MKKTYIEPKNTVVRIKLETLIASSPADPSSVTLDPSETVTDPGAREVIKSQDVWEEW